MDAAFAVAWVAERKDVLSGLFFMLTLAAYVVYVRHPFSLVRYLTVGGESLAAGLMAKPVLVTLPFVLLLLDYWPLGRMGQSGTGPFFGTGTRPFFGEKSCFAKRMPAENMELSPSAARGGQSHFRGEKAGLQATSLTPQKLGQSPPRTGH